MILIVLLALRLASQPVECECVGMKREIARLRAENIAIRAMCGKRCRP